MSLMLKSKKNYTFFYFLMVVILSSIGIILLVVIFLIFNKKKTLKVLYYPIFSYYTYLNLPHQKQIIRLLQLIEHKTKYHYQVRHQNLHEP